MATFLNFSIFIRCRKMCEFKVILNGKVIFEDVIYAKTEGEKIILKNILGALKEVEKCKIVEIDVNSERLTLSSI